MSSAAHRSIGLLACLALAAGLTACTGKDAADGETTTTAAASSSPAPASPSDSGGTESTSAPATIAAPDVPAPDPRDYPGMNEQTEQGAQQTFRYFWALVIYGYQTGDVSGVQSVSTDNCTYCRGVIEEIEQNALESRFWGRAPIVDSVLRTVDSSDPNRIGVGYGFTISAHEVTDPANGNGSESEEMIGTVSTMVWIDDAWEVDYVDLAK